MAAALASRVAPSPFLRCSRFTVMCGCFLRRTRLGSSGECHPSGCTVHPGRWSRAPHGTSVRELGRNETVSHLCYRLRMTHPTPIVTALDRAGYRLTEPRRALAALIAEQPGHFTAAEL